MGRREEGEHIYCDAAEIRRALEASWLTPSLAHALASGEAREAAMLLLLAELVAEVKALRAELNRGVGDGD
jgi:uncharacterized protein with von Willebrand factor type A (vWA) domain